MAILLKTGETAMQNIKPHHLKALRLALRLTVKRAASSINIGERTWRTYETAEQNASSITMPKERLITFCERHGVPYPPVSNDGTILVGASKVISITTYKGGVGKSPITVAVAAYIASTGKKVAIITNDIVFDRMEYYDPWITRRLEGKVRAVDFYGESNIIMYPNEVEELTRELDANEKSWLGLAEGFVTMLTDDLRKRLSAKKSATRTFENLVRDYDFIFLDLNKDIVKIKLLSHMVIVIFDIECIASVRSARNFYDDLLSPQSGRPAISVFGLVTNYAPYSGISDISECFDNPENVKAIRKIMISSYEHQSSVFQAARELKMPFLRTFLTKAHAMEIELYNKARAFEDWFCYFNSLVEIAPQSPASEEIRRLADELCSMLSSSSTLPHRALSGR